MTHEKVIFMLVSHLLTPGVFSLESYRRLFLDQAPSELTKTIPSTSSLIECASHCNAVETFTDCRAVSLNKDTKECSFVGGRLGPISWPSAEFGSHAIHVKDRTGEETLFSIRFYFHSVH